MKDTILWQDRKRILGMPISFTKYLIKNNRLYVSKGLFSTNENEILLYRILDFNLQRTLLDKILGVGTIKLITCDPTDKELYLEKIKKPKEIRDMLSDLVERQRKELNIKGREMYGVAGRVNHDDEIHHIEEYDDIDD